MLTKQDLCKQLNISLKTVYRWVQKGLKSCPSEMGFVFDQKDVDEFVEQNPELVRYASSFSPLSEEEKKHICNRAKVLLKRKNATLHAVSNQISKETGRARNTVKLLVHKHDKENPSDPIQPRKEKMHADLIYVYNAAFDGPDAESILSQDVEIKPFELLTREQEQIIFQSVEELMN